eukprot:CAMPEP_0204861806 /NCGR_PEP_ID=MMETSP1348-20121228/1906_1 /ASSEMBLY_ACC=CAM_ASM_000700 /TAXON_ID=215587 /ORGANISM="Aplanochytrium stocchinoi, Strain GSBS06" /LENGTH=270 /DNA_ID=CAMNT_0052011381 /DNA_START=54 /DNA_END=866 /DNA_ORIENTATION=-
MSIWDGFGLWAQNDPREQLREWQRAVRKEQHALDRNIREIEREERKIKQNLKNAAKKCYNDSVRRMAVELVKAQKHKDRIQQMKSHLTSVSIQLRQQSAQLRVTNTLKMSTNLMASMNKLANYSEVAASIYGLGREMERAGLIQELVDDALDSTMSDVENEVDAEIDRVIREVTEGMFESVEPTPTFTPNAPSQEQIAETGKTILLQSFESVERQPMAVAIDDNGVMVLRRPESNSNNNNANGSSSSSVGAITETTSLEARLDVLRSTDF